MTDTPTHPAATGSVRVVPIEPTEAMVKAGAKARCNGSTSTALSVWSAMLAAAPTPDAAASEAGEGWQDIASAPRDGTPFIATLIVHNLSGQKWWETHVIWADDETGEVAIGCEAGWSSVDDYSHWMPMPAPPAALTTQGGAEG